MLGVPCPSHLWACPVIMKTDPEHTAWTCSRCGRLATTPVGSGPPERLEGWARVERETLG